MLKSRFNFSSSQISVDLTVTENGLQYAIDNSKSIGNQCVIVSIQALKHKMPLNLPVCILPDGEEGKSLDSFLALMEFFSKLRLERSAVVIGLGGGALLDVVGFAASTYCRGVAWISLPTSLLSMSDACFGGKTGINFGGYKNRIGTFNHPKEIIIDLSYLESLPVISLHEGMAEIVKHGLIGSTSLFHSVSDNLKAFLSGDRSMLSEWIVESLKVKARFVGEDPFERLGMREALNFGHTVGHALEQKEQGLSHGAAVMHGMLVECAHSMLYGEFPKEEFLRFRELYHQIMGIPILKCPLYEELKRDKKTRQGVARVVRLKAIGQLERPRACTFPFDHQHLEESWDEAMRSYQNAHT